MADAAGEPDIRLSTPVRDLPGIGVRRADAFSRLGIQTVFDLIRHLPARYERHFAEGCIADLPMEGVGTARGTIVNTRYITPMGRGKGRFQATLEDHSGRISLTWFNAGYLREKLHPGMTVRVQGKVKAFGGYPQIANPKWEPLDDPNRENTADERYRPIYRALENLPSARIEELIALVLPKVLPQIVEPLPVEMLHHHAMPALPEAYRLIHLPEDEEEAATARRRLAFNELLLLQLGITIKRHFNKTSLVAPRLKWTVAIDRHIRDRFPFPLTPAQDGVVKEIAQDLQRPQPMNRLLQGDVGAGKTVVALYALLMAVADRKQGALMAPTELLAEQHYASVGRILAGSNVRLALLTGAIDAAGRRELLADVEEGRIDMVIGTQALLTESVRFRDLAVVVVDEQHRFGVLQRAAFRERGAGENSPAVVGGTPKTGPLRSPHYLVMTATPIPRTLSLTVFGDLDVSTIRGLPPGRAPIVTRVVPQAKADEVYRYIAERVKKGEQAYVVVPTIDATGHESAVQLKSVREHAKHLQDKFFSGLKVETVHGRLASETREAVMERFRSGRTQVLVATTVIEVGVDVPNAMVMVVEHAERFGLAQLHQLRGRVGRGTDGRKSLCVFISEPVTEDAAARMAVIAETNDGFRIAERDLEIRGMGDFFGTRQHGMPPLRIARIPEDMPLLQLARRDAEQMITADPALTRPEHTLLRRLLVQYYGDALGLIDVG
ncbi:MAG: ATP-dependent DNA helicase RecG [Planctomycetes bacterium]|nr:ATP-dependent DNA helicase RecG [Planctomycetota bacterium]